MLPMFFIRSQGLRKLYSRLFAPLLAQYQLTQLEADVILFLSNNPACDTARDIVEKRHLSKSHVSVAIESLAGRGLLERSTRKGNRKTVHLRLTGLAEPIAEEGRALQRRYAGYLFAGFTSGERRQLFQLLDRVAENVDAALAMEAEKGE